MIRAYQHRHRDTTSSKCECHLNRDESSSDDDKILYILFVEYCPIRQDPLARNSLDIHRPRIRSSGNDDIFRSVFLSIYLDRMTIHETRSSLYDSEV